MKVFYARVSTQEQNEARQEAAAKTAECEKVFLDKASGKNAERKALKEMLISSSSLTTKQQTLLVKKMQLVNHILKILLLLLMER